VASGLHARQYPDEAVTASIPSRFEMGYVRMWQDRALFTG